MRLRLAALAALSAATLACGETLVDHRAPDLFLPPPPPEGVTTIIQGACNTVDACGPACAPCPAPTGLAVGEASAVRACYGVEPSTSCGYECTGGFIKCAAGCCPASAVAAGKLNSCAVVTGGALYCWGDNAQGQVAPTADPSVPAPRRVHDGGVTAVAIGDGFVCAVVSGAVSCQGSFRAAGAVPSPALAGVVELAAGADHVCGRTSGGAVHCWGSNTLGQLGVAGAGTTSGTPVATGATAIAAGSDHVCALVAGAVRCWGSRAAGQLGDGSASGFSSAPVAPAVADGTGSGIGVVAAGATLSCAAPRVTTTGSITDSLQCWGTGLGSLLPASPQRTPAIPMKTATQSVVRFQVDQLGVGRAHVCVRRNGAAESIQCLGADDAAGQLGGPLVTGELTAVPGTQDAGPFAVGGDHACAIGSNGAVACWGLNAAGQLGDGSQVTPGAGGDPRPLGTPVPVAGR